MDHLLRIRRNLSECEACASIKVPTDESVQGAQALLLAVTPWLVEIRSYHDEALALTGTPLDARSHELSEAEHFYVSLQEECGEVEKLNGANQAQVQAHFRNLREFFYELMKLRHFSALNAIRVKNPGNLSGSAFFEWRRRQQKQR